MKKQVIPPLKQGQNTNNHITHNPKPNNPPPPQKTDNQTDTFKGYEPEILTVRKDYVYYAITDIKNGIEYAQICLDEHDRNLGRTNKKNKAWAETIEHDIQHMKATLNTLTHI